MTDASAAAAPGVPPTGRSARTSSRSHARAKLRHDSICNLNGHARRHADRYGDEVVVLVRSGKYRNCVRYWSNNESFLKESLSERFIVRDPDPEQQERGNHRGALRPVAVPASAAEPVAVVRKRSIFDLAATHEPDTKKPTN